MMDPAWSHLEGLIKSEDESIIKVEARYVAGAGRGLFATQDLAALETVISVPGRFLLNAKTLSASYPEPVLPQSTPASTLDALRLSSIQLLSLHLYRIKRGVKDDIFGAYINTLPSSFPDHPLVIMQNPELRPLVMKVVPPSVERMLLGVEKRLKDDWNLALDTMGLFPNLLAPKKKEETEGQKLLFEDYMWAWLNVNTRCLYHELDFSKPSDNITMCPILDFANHISIDSLSITQDEFALGDGMAFSTLSPIKKGDQIYLRYGGHSNAFLFSEYGFVLPLSLKGAHISDGEIIVDPYVEELFRGMRDCKMKEELLRDRDYWGDWTFHVQDGDARPSYRVIPALRLLHIPLNSQNDTNRELQLWEDSLVGLTDDVSKQNESKVRRSVIGLCENIIERSKNKISHVRSQVTDGEASCSAEWLQVPFLLALPKLFELYSVLERKATGDQKKSGGTIGAKFNIPNISVANTIEEFLANPELQLVIITTPNETHYPFAKAAIQAKKHVLLEKPITPTYAEAKELDSLAKSQGVVLSAFQNRRWDSDFLTLKKLISDGKLGDLVEFESRFDRYRPSPRTTAFWREAAGPGAGHTFDLGPHLIDQVLQLFGRPNRLTASIQNLRGFGGPAVDDTFLIHFYYDTKPYPVRATVAASSLSVKKAQLRFTVRGSKGSYEKRGLDPQEDQLKARKVAVLDAQFGREDESIAGTLDYITESGAIESTTVTSEKGSYQSLFENLAGAITLGADLQVKFEQSAAVIQMIELAMLSSKEGRTVEVPAP
ncbi:unnamed protein product [Rhizoctonia solani]|uniref:SET domain-containing protein n=1 Tax=Rhizoctonia solani TaxID=456999 RepID=A0A8H2X6Y9_9AGAM|nr:unnamed protein product [Rhizoctonia solani]